jgi:uncharacterized membrane protein
LAYLFIGWPVAVFLNQPKTEFASFHIRQALGIYAGVFIIWLLSVIPYIGWLFWVVGIILFFIFWTVGFMSSVQGKKVLAPYAGPWFQNWLGLLKL